MDRPRLVLHVGLPKTGTTALQERLAASRLGLARQGILYPEPGISAAHHFLAFSLDFRANGPRLMVSRFPESGPPPEALFADHWARMETEIAATRPEVVILSSEYLFSRLVLPGGAALCERLRAAFADVSVLAYLRQPSRHFTSSLQQSLKHSGQLPRPHPVSWRRHIEAWEAAFPGRLILRPYAREELEGGDITRDALLAALGRHDLPLAPAVAANEAMSAEAAVILHRFQTRKHPDKHDIPTPEKDRLRRRVARVDAALPKQASPRLHHDLARYLDEGSTELLWLRDRYGIVFAGLDYGAIRPLPRPPGRFGEVRDFFAVDAERLAAMRRALGMSGRRMAEGAGADAGQGAGSGGQAAGGWARLRAVWVRLRRRLAGRAG